MQSSLSRRVAKSITAEFVEGGVLRPGEPLPSIRTLAQKHGVSITTVAHALSILEGQGLIRRKRGEGCYLSEPAEAPVRTATLLGCVVPFRNEKELTIRVYMGVERASVRHGCHVMMGSDFDDYESERKQVERLVSAGCQAIVLLPISRVRGQQFHDYLNKEFLDIPIVLVDTGFPEQNRSQVVFDNRRAGYEMTRLLISEGHRDIVFMKATEPSGGFAVRTTRERHAGYTSALKEAGIQPSASNMWEVRVDNHDRIPSTLEQLTEIVAAWKKEKERRSAVIAVDDGFALTLIAAAKSLDVDVPRDLRVVGFDSLSRHGEWAHLGRITFPTTAPDFALAGDMATELALQELEGKLDRRTVYMLPVPVKP